MKLLLDTNIIIDLIENREPFSQASERLIRLAENNKAVECVSASAMTDIYYILRKGENGKERAKKGIELILSILEVLPINNETIRFAYQLDWDDFEDAVQYAAAKFHNVDIIITRNKVDYDKSDIAIMNPQEFLEYYQSSIG